MTIHMCEVCFKTFKTSQHLNQHKNRKKKCKGCLENLNNYFIPSSQPSSPLFENNVLSTPNIAEFPKFEHCSPISISNIPTSQNELLDQSGNLVNMNLNPNNLLLKPGVHYFLPNKLQENELNNSEKNTDMSTFTTSSIFTSSTNSTKSDISPENVSINSFIEYLVKHQKIIQETKNLELTIIQLKNQLNDLTAENIALKRKLTVVEKFIAFFKKTNKEISNSSIKNSDDIDYMS